MDRPPRLVDSVTPPPPRARLLIVDDNEDAAELLAECLQAICYDTVTAYDAPSALERLDTYVPDIALLDIGLPVMDGYELARRIRARPGLESVHLVAITGYGQESDRALAREAGFDDHFVKPVDLDALAAALERARQRSTQAVRLG